MKITNPHGYADDNTLSKVADTKDEMVSALTKDADISIYWLASNDMIANPSKFQAIFSTKQKDQQNISIQVKEKAISSQNEVEILGLTIDKNFKWKNTSAKFAKVLQDNCMHYID